jgi:hypothetical protein
MQFLELLKNRGLEISRISFLSDRTIQLTLTAYSGWTAEFSVPFDANVDEVKALLDAQYLDAMAADPAD